MERILVIGLLFLRIDETVGSSDVKSSLTFVIDNTGSMKNDIEQVEMGANAIFDTVVNSNTSQIEDFVLVTFRDPDFQLRLITKNRDDFKSALSNSTLIGNEDCPEMSMSGIELALQESREGSLLYVFTDASAKDYTKYDEVEALGQKKGSQVVFVLTGVCYGDRRREDYLVYHKLAKATNGQVFHLERKEIGQILKYVENTIENRKNIITSKTYPAGYGNTFDVDVDGDTKELIIAVSGRNPAVDVTDSGGTKWPTTDITSLHEVAIVKVVGVKPDVYKVEVGSESETRVVVSGSTSVHFQHGFSVISPSAITDTVRRPVPGEKSYLSIKLATDGGNVTLRSVQILDMDDNVILEQPLKLVDKTEQFYTTESINPPNDTFKIAIKGYDADSDTSLTRISLTPVKPQYVKPVIANKIPDVTINGSPKIKAEYDKPLQLKCKVSGYPKPTVTWESDDTFVILSYNMSVVELPYDHVSVLDLNNVRKNATYSCKAVNSEGSGNISIAVETARPRYFNVVAMPKDTTIEYHKKRKIPCKVEAYPPATVTWQKGSSLLKTDTNLKLSADGSVLTIESMEPYLADDYWCKAVNSEGRRIVPFRVNISGVEAPEIKKDTYDIYAIRHTNADIQCVITKGQPKPAIRWLYKEVASTEFITLTETTDTIHFDNVKVTDAGAYKCIAENIISKDYHEFQLIVEYKPSISRKFNPKLTKEQGDKVTLKCPVDGVPTPHITWIHDGAPIPIPSVEYSIFRDGSLEFSATSSLSGNYECEARNIHGVDNIEIELNVLVPVDIELPKNSFIEQMVGLPLALPCRADGFPRPEIEWLYRKDPKSRPTKYKSSDATGVLRFGMIRIRQHGIYTCVATNPINSKNITYVVSVLEPASIHPNKEGREFFAVEGDYQLRIPCEASGNPKPEITWSGEYGNLPSGTNIFNIGKDGSLSIKNVTKLFEGHYICTASNKFHEAKEGFDVYVREYPEPAAHPKTTLLEEGWRWITIPCEASHDKTDKILWFKGTEVMSSSALELPYVRLSDAGTYTCRVSSVDRPARTSSVIVEVGSKPQFINDAVKTIPLVMGNNAVMDCTVTGHPEPLVIWYHDGLEIRGPRFKHEFVITSPDDERGNYTCEVRNSYGTSRRDFEVLSLDVCLIHAKHDFSKNEPLMLTVYDEFPNFKSSYGYLQIPKRKRIKLLCPSGFRNILSNEIIVDCDRDLQFIVQPSGSRYSYSDLKCRERWAPKVKKTGSSCTSGNAEFLDVGFEVGGNFKEIYKICLDLDTNNTIFTKLIMQPWLANVVDNNDLEWFNNGRVNLSRLYNCDSQNTHISSILNKTFGKDDECFARRMLVSPEDVAHGLPQAATYTHLNVIPYWSKYTKNWKSVEKRIRDKVKGLNRKLFVWTGSAQTLQLPNTWSEMKNITLRSEGKEFPVPKYFWKMIQDPAQSASLAIIQVNVPDLRLKDTEKYQLCDYPLCKDVKWLPSLRLLKHGYTYCCELKEFERIFSYVGVFNDYRRILHDLD